MRKKTKLFIYIIAGLLCIIVGVAIYINSVIFTGFKIDKTVYIYVDANKDHKKLLSDIEGIAKINNISNFEMLASFYSYDKSMKTGRYAVSPDMTVLELINNLRKGHQSPVKLTFNNMRTKENLAHRISEQLMISEQDLDNALNNEELCEKYGFSTENISAMFIPNTYEFYWDISLDKFLDRMNLEYKKFWTESRLKRAEEISLTPIKCSILASIVEEECTYSDEYPTVAGLYLNRLRKGQLLQADPTIKFALGDFELKRILHKHLEVESPYNTYRNIGLPPGPIRIPSIKGIDSVLNYATHDYVYMCAKEDFSGRHNFAKTLDEHNANASRYRAALNKRAIF